jgi:hypothetical protein
MVKRILSVDLLYEDQLKQTTRQREKAGLFFFEKKEKAQFFFHTTEGKTNGVTQPPKKMEKITTQIEKQQLALGIPTAHQASE